MVCVFSSLYGAEPLENSSFFITLSVNFIIGAQVIQFVLFTSDSKKGFFQCVVVLFACTPPDTWSPQSLEEDIRSPLNRVVSH